MKEGNVDEGMAPSLLVSRGYVGFSSPTPLAIVSTIPVYARLARGVAIVEVEEDLRAESLRSLYRRVSVRTGLRGYHLLYTAASLPRHAGIEVLDDGGLLVIVSVGPRPVACTRMRSPVYKPLVGTINVVVYTVERLSKWGMLDLMRVAIEAKTVAVNELMPWCERRPLGTVTDAVVVARPRTPGVLSTSGVVTRVGGLVADAVESLVVRLWRSILSPEERIGLVLGPYAERGLLGLLAASPGLQALLLAARHLDLHRAYGTLPEALPTPLLLADAVERIGEYGVTKASHVEAVLGVVKECSGCAR